MKFSWTKFKRQEHSDKFISGKISVPSGFQADKDMFQVWIKATDIEGNSFYSFTNIDIFKESNDFRIDIPSNESSGKFRISYYYEGFEFLKEGYYTGSGTSWNENDAIWVDMKEDDAVNIQLSLLQGLSIGGQLGFQENEEIINTLDINQEISLYARAFNEAGGTYRSTLMKLIRNKDKIYYKIFVPDDPRIQIYYIQYVVVGNGDFLSNGYYFGKNKTIAKKALASKIRVFGKSESNQGNVKDINLTLLNKVVLRGKVILPDKEVAPKGGMTFDITALENEHDETDIVVKARIKEGESSGNFEIETSSNDTKKIRLKYTYWGAGYVRSGYWSKEGTIPYIDDIPEMWLDISKGGYDGLTILIPVDKDVKSHKDEISQALSKIPEITRKIIKPDWTEFEKILAIHDFIVTHLVYYSDDNARLHKLPATEDIYYMYAPVMKGVAVCGTYTKYFTSLMKEAGLDSKGIGSLNHAWNQVHLGGNIYHVDTTINDDAKDSFNYAYFMLSDEQRKALGGSWNEIVTEKARRQFVFDERYYINKEELKAVDYRRIMGTVYLPENDAAPEGGYWIKINGNKFYIPEGENFTFYALRIPVKDTPSVILEFGINSNSYVNKGYYTKKGIVSNKESAEKLSLSGNDLTGIDFKITNGKGLKINMTLPQDIELKSDLKIKIFLSDEAKKEVLSNNYVLPKGKKNSNYTTGCFPGDITHHLEHLISRMKRFPSK
jgi:hypothetical protein